ncbi:MAG: ParA family protein [Candidatus Competibacteraceae bacterium]|nr:ParA family protein [Candidatus Competibacteraceae bacterium]
MPRKLSFVSAKGGTGKTSCVVNIGYELAMAGHSTLLIDFDPQANLTIHYGLDPTEERPTALHAMRLPDKSAGAIVELRPKLDIIPANLALAQSEYEFAADPDRDIKLQSVVKMIERHYDFILIDTPPTIGFFTSNALTASNEAILPLQCQFFAFKMLDIILTVIEKAQRVAPDLRISAVVPTMYDARNSLSEPVVRAARERFGELVTQTVIPVNIRIADAPMYGLPVAEHDPRATGAQAYQELTKEILRNGH